ncbi:4Fe-4S dicluster domain-containing protein [Dehalococcoidia bacterium]|nr:4Fe-4S dicluster domain-containing protein [Dehalococcoidia bacterium]
MQQKLRHEAGALLEQDKVDLIIGFEPGSLKFTTTPLITRDKDDLDRLVINPFIVNNLAVFLPDIKGPDLKGPKLKGRVAIVAKGCDSRSIVSLIQDNKVSRDDLVIIGIPCPGMIELRKVEKLTGKDRDELDDIIREGDKVVITVDGKASEFPISDVLFDNCLGCEFPTPQDYDILLGEPTTMSQESRGGGLWTPDSRLQTLKGMSPQERWEFWRREFRRCIRCYACRNICPSCFCQRCFVEESEPQWLMPVPRWQENLVFQAIRNIHLAGRCTDCGGCERSCPVNIPLRSLTREMYDLVDELFHFKAGKDKDAPPLMTHYEQEEAEDLIR